MRYDIRLFNAGPNVDGDKYICGIQPDSRRAGIFLIKEFRFKNEDDMREKLDGILPAYDIDSTIHTLRAQSKDVLHFSDVEITEQQAESLGLTKGKQQ
jgi:hypothetical protein